MKKGVIEYRTTIDGKQKNYAYRYNGFISFIKGIIKANLKGANIIINHKNI